MVTMAWWQCKAKVSILTFEKLWTKEDARTVIGVVAGFATRPPLVSANELQSNKVACLKAPSGSTSGRALAPSRAPRW